LTPNQCLETIVVGPQRTASAAGRDAILIHIYPTGPGMGRRYSLSAGPLTIGRGPECEVCVTDSSVSRRHARIEPDEEGYRVIDLGSTNGTEVNDVSEQVNRLRNGDYLRVGHSIFRFLAGGNVEAEYHEEIYRLTIMDALTGIHNKRYLLEWLETELTRSERHHRPLSLILFDLDHFKRVNDDLGHLAGDYTLRDIAGCVQQTVRRGELFARYGGEEFAVALPETTRDQALATAERIRALVEAHPVRFGDQTLSVTISLGVAATVGETPLSPEGLIALADGKLYEAKNAGRNRVAG
jgi:two-component system, cell cycle response regulator